jgi:hypothetical protein
MRIALCFSGQLRNVKQTYEQYWLPNVLTPNAHHQIDTFVHSWYDKSTTGTSFVTAGGGIGSHPTPANVIQDIYDIYNPVTMVLQHQLPFDEKNYNDNKYPMIIPKFTLSKMYSSWMCNQLKSVHEGSQNQRYDVVAVARFDWAFQQPVLFDAVTTPGVYHPGLNPHGINVGFVMGDSTSIDRYNMLFHDVQSVYDAGVPFCDEILAQAYLGHLNIPIHNLQTPSTINRG